MWLSALPASAEPQPAPSASDAEIVIEGRSTGDRYRIPEKLRPLTPADTPRAPALSDPRLACSNVGPYGCGTEVLPILTVRGDGSTQIGATPDGR